MFQKVLDIVLLGRSDTVSGKEKFMFAHTLILLGAIINFAGCLMFWIAAKKVSTGWFVGCLFLFVWPFFLIAHFSRAWKPLAVWIAGLLIMAIGTLIKTH